MQAAQLQLSRQLYLCLADSGFRSQFGLYLSIQGLPRGNGQGVFLDGMIHFVFSLPQLLKRNFFNPPAFLPY